MQRNQVPFRQESHREGHWGVIGLAVVVHFEIVYSACLRFSARGLLWFALFSLTSSA